MKQKIALGLLVFYILIRFFFTTWLDTIFDYSSFTFEIILVAIVAVLFKKEFLGLWRLNKKHAIFAGAALLSGFVIYKLAGVFQIPIPFDVTGKNVWFFLLLLGPILEELIFRFFVWQPLRQRPRFALAFTSLLFAFSHFHAFWFVSPDIRSFVYYQTFYTLGLGLACGYMIYRYRSLAAAMLLHLGFNLGFYLAAIL
jgi:membrane protease YdiL (CAAX protease family)